jgi:hypothetical protein
MRTRVLLAMALFVAALAVACDDDEDGGEDESATQSPSASPAAAEPTSFSSSQLPVPVTISADDSYEVPEGADTPFIFVVAQKGAPFGYVDVWEPQKVYTRSSPTELRLSDPPADYVQWFADNPALGIGETTEVDAGGRPATRLDVSNGNDDVALFELPSEEPYEFQFRQHSYVYVVDVDGTQVVVLCGTDNRLDFDAYAATCDELLANAEFGS